MKELIRRLGHIDLENLPTEFQLLKSFPEAIDGETLHVIAAGDLLCFQESSQLELPFASLKALISQIKKLEESDLNFETQPKRKHLVGYNKEWEVGGEKIEIHQIPKSENEESWIKITNFKRKGYGNIRNYQSLSIPIRLLRKPDFIDVLEESYKSFTEGKFKTKAHYDKEFEDILTTKRININAQRAKEILQRFNPTTQAVIDKEVIALNLNEATAKACELLNKACQEYLNENEISRLTALLSKINQTPAVYHDKGLKDFEIPENFLCPQTLSLIKSLELSVEEDQEAKELLNWSLKLVKTA